MPLLQWTQDMSVNIVEIDNQHKKLVNLINLLHDSMKEGKGREALKTVLEDLANYTVYHFETEEKLFRTHAYPEYVHHKKEHDDLTKQVLAIKTEYEGGKSNLTIDLMNFLKNWLNHHILNSDKRYSSYLNTKGVH